MLLLLLGCVVAVGLLFAFSHWGVTPCTNVRLSESISPDGFRKVVVFKRECGTSTGSTYQGAIIPVDAPYPSTPGNVFITTQQGIKVTWNSPTEVAIEMSWGRSVLKQETLVDGVVVFYP